MIKSGERKDAKLKPQVPLHWIYVTAWATADGVVQFRDDIYNRDGLSQPRVARIDIDMTAQSAGGPARAACSATRICCSRSRACAGPAIT